jgi:hypothetical protein
MPHAAAAADDPAAFWLAVSRGADPDTLEAALAAAPAPPSPPPSPVPSAPLPPPLPDDGGAAGDAPPALNVPWLAHLAGPAAPPGACAGGSAEECAALLRALSAALPELHTHVEPLIAARGLPGDAFVGACSAQRCVSKCDSC